MAWHRKDFLSLRELSAEELNQVLATARVFKEILGRPIKKVPSLQGRTVVNLFVEPSTRTRISFELAAVRLSADVVSLDKDSSSLRKGETLSDTARNLEALQAGVIVIRHRSAGAAHFLAGRLKASVVNAGDGAHEHPTQGLLDAFTIQERLGKLAGVRVLIVGDIIHSRVARSNLWALTKLGARVTLVGPPTLLPREFAELGVKVSYDLDGQLEEADVINLLRIQHERMVQARLPSVGEYAGLFGLNLERFQRCKPGVLLMHPGPVHRGVEIASELADGTNSVILEQVTNGLAVRMAVLY
ncbi:MAG: aspartate carbamoyltransferase catalytic subunit, partial [Verrucomicrobia bacterium]|nr:aspartate carbamoyltransferase catalytic subunit [Verrucomicrobiota bacterium]